CQHYYASPYSF
nr:immunoglobulin light chain junction region [Macaca mulatta]